MYGRLRKEDCEKKFHPEKACKKNMGRDTICSVNALSTLALCYRAVKSAPVWTRSPNTKLVDVKLRELMRTIEALGDNRLTLDKTCKDRLHIHVLYMMLKWKLKGSPTPMYERYSKASETTDHIVLNCPVMKLHVYSGYATVYNADEEVVDQQT
ncbi:hypothetical protein ElyMa_003323000 [Elysia marginata]|uniref:Uncharacterized protein n=1 Tax=Elysia marginata TaxID=1093978 RepID=A0AAV4JEK7_9GAST|nr:hypothetical protein ElyMa_003323000 [Elysia marginata]